MVQIDDAGLIAFCRKLIQTPSLSGQENGHILLLGERWISAGSAGASYLEIMK